MEEWPGPRANAKLWDEWLGQFEYEDNLDLRPPKSSLTAGEILEAVVTALRDPGSPFAVARTVGNQAKLEAGEATAHELALVVDSAAWEGAARAILAQATLIENVEGPINLWASHPLRGRRWKPNGKAKEWLIIRLATEAEVEEELGAWAIEHADQRQMFDAMDREVDPPADPPSVFKPF